MTSQIKEKLQKKLEQFLCKKLSESSKVILAEPEFEEILQLVVEWLYNERINAALEFANHVTRTINDTRVSIEELRDGRSDSASDFLGDLHRL